MLFILVEGVHIDDYSIYIYMYVTIYTCIYVCIYHKNDYHSRFNIHHLTVIIFLSVMRTFKT